MVMAMAKVDGVTLEFGADVEALLRGLNKVQAATENAAAGASELEGAFSGAKKGLDGLDGGGMNALNAALKSLENSINALIGAFQSFQNGARDAFATVKQDATEAVKSVGDIRKTLAGGLSMPQGFKVQGPVIDVAPASVSQVKGRMDELKANLKRGAGEAGKEAGKSLKNGFAATAQLKDALAPVKGFFDDYQQKFKYLAVGKSLSIAAEIGTALNVGGGFEAQMTNVKVISGATAKELEELTAKAREMGASLPITAKDAAAAMELLAQRGNSAKDIIASVTDVSNLAISQNIDLAEAADLLGSTMTNFGIAVTDAARVTDVFNNASNQSAMSIQKLAEGLKFAGPMAAAAGMSLEDTVAAMEVLANAGLGGSMIGTGLSAVLSKLASSASVLGVQTRNLDGTLRPLKDVFTELQARGMTLGDATEAFGLEAAKAAVNLTKYAGTLDQNAKNLKALGSTQAAVQEKMKAWPNVWNSFMSAAESVHITVFDQIKEQSKAAVSDVADLTRIFDEWVGQTKIAEKTVKAFLSGLGFSIMPGDSFKKFLATFDIDAFVKRIGSFGKTIRKIIDDVAGIIASLKGPISFLIGNIDSIAKISFWKWIIEKGLQIPKIIKEIAGAFTSLKDAIIDFPSQALNSLGEVLIDVTAEGAIGGFFGALIDNSRDYGSYLGNVAEGVMNLSSSMKQATGPIGEYVRNLGNVKKGVDLGAFTEQLVVHKGLLNSIPAAPTVTPTVNLKALGSGLNKGQELWNQFNAKFDSGVKKLKGVTNSIGGAFMDMFSGIANFIGPSGMIATGITSIIGLASHVSNEMKKVRDEVRKLNEESLTEEMANRNLRLEMTASKRTGFEEKPEAYAKASIDERTKFDQFVQARLEKYAELYKKALEQFNTTTGKELNFQFSIPNSLEELTKSSTLKEFARILEEGDLGAFDNMEAPFRAVLELMRQIIKESHEFTDNLSVKLENRKQDADKAADEERKAAEVRAKMDALGIDAYLGDKLDNILKEIPGRMNRALKALGGTRFDFVVGANIDEAQAKIKELAARIASDMHIPESVALKGIVDQIRASQISIPQMNEAGKGSDFTSIADINQMLADSLDAPGEKVSQFMDRVKDAVEYLGASPANFMPALNALGAGIEKIHPLTGRVTEDFKVWYGAVKELTNASLDKFIGNAKDAMNYLGASPSQFMPALQKLMSGIQKTDKLTGELTEGFKKAYDTLKEWANITFDNLKNKIADLKRAVEGGFLNKKALDAELEEFERTAILKIAADLEPRKGELGKNYDAVFASKVFEEMRGAFGDEAANKRKEEWAAPYKQWDGKFGINALERGFGDLLKRVQTEAKLNAPQPQATKPETPVAAEQTKASEATALQTILVQVKDMLSGLATAGTVLAGKGATPLAGKGATPPAGKGATPPAGKGATPQSQAAQSFAGNVSAVQTAVTQVVTRLGQMEKTIQDNTQALRDAKMAMTNGGKANAAKATPTATKPEKSEPSTETAAQIDMSGIETLLGDIKTAIEHMSKPETTGAVEAKTTQPEPAIAGDGLSRIEAAIAENARVISAAVGSAGATGESGGVTDMTGVQSALEKVSGVLARVDGTLSQNAQALDNAGRLADSLPQIGTAVSQNAQALDKAATAISALASKPSNDGGTDTASQTALTQAATSLGNVENAILASSAAMSKAAGALEKAGTTRNSSSGGGDVTINLQDFTVKSESDIQRIKQVVQDALRSAGILRPGIGLGTS